MNRNSPAVMIGVTLLSGVGALRTAQAGGIQLYEIATPDVGLASAGYAARADDASTVFKNPAGMSRLSGAQLQGGVQALYGDVSFSPDSNTQVSGGGNDGGNAVGWLPGGSLFVTVPLSEKFQIGLGTFSYFGLAQEYDDGWVGRYYIQKGTLLGMTLMPAVSFKATDWLSIGAGLNAMYGYLDTEVAIRTGPLVGDGLLTVKDEEWGFGANAGVLIQPSEGTRFGVTYLSPVALDFADVPTFSGNLGALGNLPLFQSPPQLDLGVTVPQSVMVSAYQQVSPKWALLANVGWQNWSQFGKVDIGVQSASPTSLTTDLNYQDTWHGALGAQFRASEKWLLSAGLAYDSSSVADEDRTVTLPMGEAYRFGLGAQWQVSQAVNLGAAYEFLWAGDMSVVQDSPWRGRVSGSYEEAFFSFFTVNLTWRF